MFDNFGVRIPPDAKISHGAGLLPDIAESLSGKNLKGLSFLKATAILGLIVVPGIYVTPAWGQNVFWKGRLPLLPGERYQQSVDLLPQRSPSDLLLLTNI